MAFDINNALNTLTGTVGREMVDAYEALAA